MLLTLGIYGVLVAATHVSATVENMLITKDVDGVGGQQTTGNLNDHKDTSNTVNITEKARTLIEYMNRTWHDDISSWGMTSDYAFWSGNHNRFGQQPISAHAGNFNCDKELLDFSDLDVRMVMCLWYIPKKICSPVGIYVNLTAPVYRNGIIEEKPITLDFNNRHTLVRRAPQRKRRQGTKGLKKFVEVCAFTVNVTFHGSLAYETNNPGTGKRFYSVGVGLLQDKSVGLIRTKHNRLSYIIRGLFKRVTFWKSYAHFKQNLFH